MAGTIAGGYDVDKEPPLGLLLPNSSPKEDFYRFNKPQFPFFVRRGKNNEAYANLFGGDRAIHGQEGEARAHGNERDAHYIAVTRYGDNT